MKLLDLGSSLHLFSVLLEPILAVTINAAVLVPHFLGQQAYDVDCIDALRGHETNIREPGG